MLIRYVRCGGRAPHGTAPSRARGPGTCAATGLARGRAEPRVVQLTFFDIPELRAQHSLMASSGLAYFQSLRAGANTGIAGGARMQGRAASHATKNIAAIDADEEKG